MWNGLQAKFQGEGGKGTFKLKKMKATTFRNFTILETIQ